jgi:hypothetical protein
MRGHAKRGRRQALSRYGGAPTPVKPATTQVEPAPVLAAGCVVRVGGWCGVGFGVGFGGRGFGGLLESILVRLGWARMPVDSSRRFWIRAGWFPGVTRSGRRFTGAGAGSPEQAPVHRSGRRFTGGRVRCTAGCTTATGTGQPHSDGDQAAPRGIRQAPTKDQEVSGERAPDPVKPGPPNTRGAPHSARRQAMVLSCEPSSGATRRGTTPRLAAGHNRAPEQAGSVYRRGAELIGLEHGGTRRRR